MKTSKITKLGYLAGGLMVVLSFYRYYFLYQDIDKLVAYTLIGVAIIGVFFNYDSIKKIIKRVGHIDDVMSEIINEK